MATNPGPDGIRSLRMVSLLLSAPEPRNPVEITRWFGAMQAQDVASGYWSLGVRAPGSTSADVDRAFGSGELIRTWPMRQTVHVIPAVDATWMLDLTARRRLDQMVDRRQQLGLLPRDLDRLAASLQAILASGEPVTRKDVLDGLAAEGIAVDGQRGYHLLLYSSLIGLTCIGPQRDGSQTFALLSAWAPSQRDLTREEALAELAFRYFRSHGPTTVRDFAGWSGLTLADARAGTQANDGRLVPLADGAEAAWCTSDLAELSRAGVPVRGSVVALPGFDEYMLGYKDRSLHGDERLLERVVPGGNGVFRATVVIDGTAAATWTRTLTPRAVTITVQPFEAWTPTRREHVARAFAPYGEFLGREAVVSFADPL